MQQERHAAVVLGKPHESGAAMQSGGTSLPYVRVEMTVCCVEGYSWKGRGEGVGEGQAGRKQRDGVVVALRGMVSR